MRIDAHQHFWSVARGDYGWLTPDLTALYRDFGPDDLLPLLNARGIDGSVLVQAAPTLAETEFMLSIAKAQDRVLGVVGWVDFETKAAPDTIAQLARHPKLVGLRPMIQNLPDDTWMLRDDLTPAFRAMVDQGLVFDALTFPRHLPHLRALLERHPDMTVVIDHGSKPEIAAGRIKRWAADMAALADETQAVVKLSGLVTEAGDSWSVDSLRPYVEHLIAHFGPDRMLWGSDWPVLTRACPYDSWCAATDVLLSGLTADEQATILGRNAQRVYKLGEPA